MNIRFLLKASALALGFAAISPAQAVTFEFLGGGSAPLPGYSVINQFNNVSGISGDNFQILTPPSSSAGAPPEYAYFGTDSYLSVLSGGTATINFDATNSVMFDWGSIDAYNTLTVLLAGGGTYDIIPGGNFDNLANGNQTLENTNGLFTINAGLGESIVGLTLQSSDNSFEIDNLAIAPVPEPATWMMMIGGLGLVGGMMRRRSAAVRVTYA